MNSLAHCGRALAELANAYLASAPLPRTAAIESGTVQAYAMDRLRETVRVPVRVLHVVRNPYDNIATMARRAGSRGEPDLDGAIERYLLLDDTAARLGNRLGAEARELRHEELVRDPVSTLASLCRRLRLEPTPEYLDACAAIVFQHPRRTRHDVAWSERHRATVEERIASRAHLRGYGFDT